MVVEVTITGAEHLAALSRDLKAAGASATGLRRELLAGMRAVGKPLAEAAKDSARDHLPQRGGLNVWVATGAKIAVRNNLTGSASRIGMRIVATKGSTDLEGMDAGSVRHPVYGNRKKWVSQTIATGWFSKPLEERVPEVQAALTLAMDVIGRRIEKGVF